MKCPVLSLMILFSLVACGQKGPLYLPGKVRGDQATRSDGAAGAPAGDSRAEDRENHHQEK